MEINADDILTAEEKQKIEEHLANMKGCEKLINRMKTAGFDTTDVEKRCKETKEKLLKLKRAFAPNA